MSSMTTTASPFSSSISAPSTTTVYQFDPTSTATASSVRQHLSPGAIAGITIAVAVVVIKLAYAAIYWTGRRRMRKRMNEKMRMMLAAQTQVAELGGDTRFEVPACGRNEMAQPEKAAELHATSVCELSSAYPCSEMSGNTDERWRGISPYAGDIAKR